MAAPSMEGRRGKDVFEKTMKASEKAKIYIQNNECIKELFTLLAKKKLTKEIFENALVLAYQQGRIDALTERLSE